MGAGQLARMMGEAAREANLELTVLAASPDDSAVATADAAVIGAATTSSALNELASRSSVITFDHELVDLEELARTGRPRRQSFARTLARCVLGRQGVPAASAFDEDGLPVPRFLVVESPQTRCRRVPRQPGPARYCKVESRWIRRTRRRSAPESRRDALADRGTVRHDERRRRGATEPA